VPVSGGGNSFVNSGAQVELMKQEVVFSATPNSGRQTMQQTPNKQPSAAGSPMMGTGYPNAPKQQYSPYGSPGPLPNHGSPQYLPRGQTPQGTPQHVGQFSSSTPPRPPSCPGTASLQINQAQQMQVNQQGQQIQVSVFALHRECRLPNLHVIVCGSTVLQCSLLCHLLRQAKTGGCGTKSWSSADGTVVERACRNSGNHGASGSRRPAEILTEYPSNKCLRLAV
jgi:hypothetical protein